VQVTSLRIYAVKSMAGVDVETAEIEPWGIAGDRRWGVVDDAGTKITAREMYGLLGMRAEPVGSSGVRILDRAGTATLVDAPHYAAPISVSHYRQGQARPASEETNRWLTQRVGRPVRLVWQGDPTARSIAEQHGGKPGDTLSLADAGPLLLVSEASMAQLNAWIAADANLDDVPDLDRPVEPHAAGVRRDTHSLAPAGPAGIGRLVDPAHHRMLGFVGRGPGKAHWSFSPFRRLRPSSAM